MLNDEVMEAIIKKCKEDPKYNQAFTELMKWSQLACSSGMNMEEIAAICTMGYVVAKDPTLQNMIKNMIKINDLDLDII